MSIFTSLRTESRAGGSWTACLGKVGSEGWSSLQHRHLGTFINGEACGPNR